MLETVGLEVVVVSSSSRDSNLAIGASKADLNSQLDWSVFPPPSELALESRRSPRFDPEVAEVMTGGSSEEN